MTPTEERELLELAAQAYGLLPLEDGLELDIGPNGVALMICGNGETYYFDSLHDSGDCFDLAAHCKIDVLQYSDEVIAQTIVGNDVMDGRVSLEWESERPAATRLAVTRAAAEIGRRMKG